ncbi:MAG TPA: hypothetical protein VNJ04_02205, partial [Gemmatimonadaceae bacterium]|nr:hypothetical protein [Gemmatimonadaceae bacterium]
DGAHWQSLRRNLPIVPVHDLAVKEGDLVAGTHGRSFWILDDLSALRQMTPAVTRSSAHLFKPRKVYRASFGGGGGGAGGNTGAAGGHPVGANPPSGGLVYYWLDKPRQVVTLDFLDPQARIIRSFTSRQDATVAADSVRADSVKSARADSLRLAGVKADSTVRSEERSEETAAEDGPVRRPPPPRVADKRGLNTFAWNLRYPDASSFENMILWAGGTSGPVVVPGVYSVRMTVNGQSFTQPLTVVKDPRSPASQAELQEQFDFLMRIRNRTSEANDAVRLIRNVKAQLADRGRKIGSAEAAPFRTEADALTAALSRIEAQIYQVQNQSGQDPLNYPIRLNNKIAALSGVASSADARPTSQTQSVFNELSAQLDVQLAAMRSELRALTGLNAKLRAAGLAEVTPSTEEIKPPPVRAAGGADASDG